MSGVVSPLKGWIRYLLQVRSRIVEHSLPHCSSYVRAGDSQMRSYTYYT